MGRLTSRRQVVRGLRITTAALALWLVVSWAVAYRLTRRPHPRFDEPPPSAAWGEFEPHTIKTRDGHELGAWLVRGRADAPSVLLLHGNGGSRWNCLSRAEVLAGEGCTVLLVSLRAHGDSTGEFNDIGYSAATTSSPPWTSSNAAAPASRSSSTAPRWGRLRRCSHRGNWDAGSPVTSWSALLGPQDRRLEPGRGRPAAPHRPVRLSGARARLALRPPRVGADLAPRGGRGYTADVPVLSWRAVGTGRRGPTRSWRSTTASRSHARLSVFEDADHHNLATTDPSVTDEK